MAVKAKAPAGGMARELGLHVVPDPYAGWLELTDTEQLRELEAATQLVLSRAAYRFADDLDASCAPTLLCLAQLVLAVRQLRGQLTQTADGTEPPEGRTE